jgi:lysine/ornithine N-monooxygenase
MSIYIQFEDETKTKVVSWYTRQPKVDSEPFLGEVEANDPRYMEYYYNFSESMREAMPAPTSEE